MNIPRHLVALAASLLATTAWAQTAGKPLNLKLLPSDTPAASSTAAKPAASAPGVYYGDTSGRMGNNDTTAAATPTDDCDDYSYNQPQMHGSVGMGVVGGNHVSGNYQTGTVNLSKAFGSCDHPSGGVSISIGGGTGHFNGRRDH
ncbi:MULTISPECIES: hypothetical protein [Rhodanobacter]|uniref:hypothetical protein n=1 Tax=Rhodanobacter TaxID=75309 RepID=UPI000418509E|nr:MULTISPECIES: hypothetical protein [Rhodanobacter]KZC19437.1 hypothetical protein RHOFW104R3_31200 [Rhodanobacter denitrificans]UJJ50020.1 hypothetical protein LRK52_12365 [Rhodanobacter denitrificans]UJM92734.1 hypothetical protein LRK32_12275 [Rhodanobacter denitrificans]UJM96264.1 hypothetical protein LRK44_12280 [Rhodanobacter denitrificans]UJN20905.1 hypothetical protein LRK54_14360 [Rhodanobacter denitrificans]